MTFAPMNSGGNSGNNTLSQLSEAVMGLLQQTGNVLYFGFDVQGSGQFEVVDFEFEEALSSLFNGRFKLASQQFHLDPENFLDRDARLTVYRDGQLERVFHGIIKSFAKGDTGHEHTYYEVELVPSLYRLDLKSDSRIFQGKSVVDISEVLFKEMGITDYALSMQGQHIAREYCVQYRETCLEFLSRLWAEEGIFYYFEHEEEKHTLVLSDASSGTKDLESEYLYNSNAGGAGHQPFIRSFGTQAQLAFTNSVLKDYSFKQPSADFLSHEFGDDEGDGYEYYDYPGRYKDNGVGKSFAKTRIQYLQRDSRTMLGDGMFSDFSAGHHFALSEHSDDAYNRKWLLTSVIHKGTQPQALGKYGLEGMTTYNNHFTGIANNRQWKPEPTTKPRVDGPQVAKVVGPKGEEIYCDEFGRVKVQFPWDRYGSSNEESTCWIRVVQGWAGASYGQVSIPRIGHEVIVSFLEGDPDQPIVTGRAYHATNRQPFKLPANKTVSGIKTQTHKGEGYNEYSFDDANGEEKITVHAQKDMNTLVKNDQVTHIEHDYHLKVDNLLMTLVKNDAHYTVEGERRTEVKSNEHYKTEASLHAKQGGKWLVETGDEIHFKAGSKIVFEAGDEITTKVGGSFVKITASQIDIVGPVVNINAGGSPGDGTPIEILAPLTPAQLSSMGGPAPFCEECEKCKNGNCEIPNPSEETKSVAQPDVGGTPALANGMFAASDNAPAILDPLKNGIPESIFDAPNKIDFSSLNDVFNQLWQQSFPNGNSQEFGGTLVRDLATGAYALVNQQGGDSGSFIADYGNLPAGSAFAGVFHTHPYDKSEGGHTGVSFSRGDFGNALLRSGNRDISITQSGDAQFMLLNTKENAGTLSRNEISKLFNDYRKEGGREFVEGIDHAVSKLASENGLAYYKGKGGVFTKVMPSGAKPAVKPKFKDPRFN